MNAFSFASGVRLVSRLKSYFKTRDVILQGERDLQRFSLGGRTRRMMTSVAGITLCCSFYGVAHAGPIPDAPAADMVAPLVKDAPQQGAVVAPERLSSQQTAKGGPFEAADSAAVETDMRADTQFRSLFMTWKKLDTLEQSVIAIPSTQPVDRMAYTSNYGVRADPFRGTAAMHAGVDIPGPVGTPIYATADGMVERAERSGGYGNLVELDHGKGIQTRYGHLSKILVEPGTRVRRGQLIALMGSTGRSTGPHLHYEVRLDGHAVNPVPFLQTADYLLAAQDKSVRVIPVGVGGPAAAD